MYVAEHHDTELVLDSLRYIKPMRLRSHDKPWSNTDHTRSCDVQHLSYNLSVVTFRLGTMYIF